MDKAKRIYQELLQQKTGVWYVSDIYGSKIMIKVPSSTIKAIIKGCKLEFVFGIDDNIFHVGARIYDDPINFLTITAPHKNMDEHLSIAKIMSLNKVHIQLCNELGVCQAFGDIVLNEKNNNDVLCLLGNPKRLYTGNLNERLISSSDNFQFSLGLDIPYFDNRSPNKIQIISIDTKIENLQVLNNIFYGETGTFSTEITNSDEGKLLEKEVFIALRSLFGSNVYLNPHITNKKDISRELIDILAFSDIGIFLIESKALGVNNAVEERSMSRKIKGLQDQIKKGIKQLVGALKRITNNELIYDESGQKVYFNRTLPPCGIVLVSELLHFGEWEEILSIIVRAMRENGILIHIMDLNELMQFITYSNGDKYRFDDYLLERIKSFTENPSIFRQTKFIKET